MQVFTPSEVAKHATNKYLSVLIAAKFARVLNEFPRDRSVTYVKRLVGLPGDNALSTVAAAVVLLAATAIVAWVVLSGTAVICFAAAV